MKISAREKARLRELAKRQAEIAALPVMQQRRKLWYRLNDGDPQIPLVTFDFNGPPEEIYPACQCVSPLAREIEAEMLRNLTHHTLLNDDRVIEGCVHVRIPNDFVAFGIEEKRITVPNNNGMGYTTEHPIRNLEEDFHLLGRSQFTVDAGLKKAKDIQSELKAILGDILSVNLEFPSFQFFPAGVLCALMGMENMMLAMYDCPDSFHKAMSLLTDDYLVYMDELENVGALLPNNDGSYLNQGSWGYTTSLPSPNQIDRRITFQDVWGYTNFQESIGISGPMFDEFFFSYAEKICRRFGLLSYGCCEPVDGVWDRCLSRLHNLRKLSISPWCDEEAIAERIRGKKIVYQRKPSPNFICADNVFHEDAFRAHITKTIEAARGCPLEITFRDVITVKGESWRMKRAIDVTREQLARCWHP